MHLRFDVEVLEDQRQLNGTRYVSLEGAEIPVDGQTASGWTLALNFAQPKDASLDEADLTLSSLEGSVFAGLESGRTDIVNDDIGGDERESIDLTLRIVGGDGGYSEAAGQIRLSGDLQAVGGQFEISLLLTDSE